MGICYQSQLKKSVFPHHFLSKQIEMSAVLALLQGLSGKAMQSEQIHQEGGLTTGVPCPPFHRDWAGLASVHPPDTQ